MAFESPGPRALRMGKRLLESLTRMQLAKSNHHGLNPWRDIARTGCAPRVILDVGANVGQTAERLRSTFPAAEIHSFEPVGASFRQLERAARRLRVVPHQLALGSTPGSTTIGIHRCPLRSGIAIAERAVETQEVEMSTVDAFMDREGIPRVEVLKIDTEGHDLEVLRGAGHSLENGRLDFVIAEVGFAPNGIHVPYEEIRDFLSEFGFRVFGIYDQAPMPKGTRELRYGNALFALNA